ncbi:cytochrome D ubiquinol oxidase subunit I [Syntrophotalea acetylenivorans]|uniref:Cytochrome D ubiquinol oxidase subunit I n=1 Tax=Syntrophotalea acetylenivorans TaxID=1842532 RepID=A0A1L3GPX0_9BACT|nr:cytochrome ubiquinol oxidase subunit I [Syntrophotalea acetylenivorans]APG27943.1 cytochrome D ubiquinol oxidase subunit I [Syntrophotalea acetylenivorans]
MDVVALSRLQFAVTSMFHFIFVPLTLGLVLLVAWMETRYVRTGDEMYKRMAKFWGKLFLINFALGIVTGITLEFQFGMNWAEYSRYVGDIFGAPLAIEATAAFFLESVFIGVWAFGWDKVSKKVHLLSIWIVAISSNLSALWILLANGWMQNPVGYVLRNGRAEMVDFGAMFTNPYGVWKFYHTVVSCYTVGAFFVMGISAWHLLRGSKPEFFRRSFRMGAYFGLVAIALSLLTGDYQAEVVARYQPAKLAAMEAHWETGTNAGIHLLAWPDAEQERNVVEAAYVPGVLSYLAYRDLDAEVVGLNDIPREDRPPILPVFLSFRAMVGLGGLMVLASVLAAFFVWRGTLDKQRLFLRLLIYFIPIPYLTIQLGWLVAEVGRQPWLVYGVMRTSEGVSTAINATQVVVSLIGFTLLYSALGFIDIYLLFKFSRKGPEESPAAQPILKEA